MAISQKTYDKYGGWISKYYKDIFGGGPRAIDVANWQDQFAKSYGENATPKQIYEGMDAAAKNLLVGKYEIKPEVTPEQETDKSMDWIKQLYSSMQPEIESGVKSAAAQRGGLDTGGYLTSMGKAKASTWQDMLKTMIGVQGQKEALGEQRRQFDVTQENLKGSQADQYRLLTEQLKANQPGGWDYILGGAAAGATLGPWGALGGALLGWGKKQGLFGE